MLNQRQIIKLSFDTLLGIEACASGGTADRLLSYCVETRTLYNYVSSAPSMTPNGTSILITGDGGDTRWVGIAGQYDYFGGSSGAGVSITNELLINATDPEVTGKQYQSFANAFAYLATVMPAPSASNPWAVRFTGTNNETIVLPAYVRIVGDGQETSILTGSIDFISSSTDYPPINSISNCTIINLAPTPGTPQPVIVSIQAGPPLMPVYTPDVVNFRFKNPPSNGLYNIDLGLGGPPPIPMDSFSLDNGGVAVDAGGGEVTLPCAGITLVAGNYVRITNSVSYNGDFRIVSVGTGTFNITAGFYAETFTGSETVKRYFGFDESAISIENALKALDPSMLANITVTGDYMTGFVLTCTGIPAGTPFAFTAPVNTVGEVFTSSTTPGTVEVREIDFSAVPTQGQWQFKFTYLTVDYTSVLLPYNVLPSSPIPMIKTVQSEIRRLLGLIYTATGSDFGKNDCTVTQMPSGNFVIDFKQSQGDASGVVLSYLVYALDPLLAGGASGKKVWIQNVRLKGASSNSGDGNSLLATNCVISGGALMGFDSNDLSLISNSMIYTDDNTNPLQLPKSKFVFTNCTIRATNISSLILIGADFDNCVIKDADKIVWTVDGSMLATYNFSNCFIDGVLTPASGVTINTYCSTFKDAISLPMGVTLNNYNSVLLNGTIWTGGMVNDKGNFFNPFGTSLVSYDSNDAIKEIALLAAPGASVSNEITIRVAPAPEVVGKQYNSFANAFAYIATQGAADITPWNVRFSGWNNESFDIPEYVSVIGEDAKTSILDGEVRFANQGLNNYGGNNLVNCTVYNFQTKENPQNSVLQQSAQVPYTPSHNNFYFASIPTDPSGYVRITINNNTLFVVDVYVGVGGLSNSSIQSAIQAFDPSLATVTCLGSGTVLDPYIVSSTGIRADAVIGVIDFTVEQTMFIPVYTAGIGERDWFGFFPVPNVGTFVLGYNYLGTDYWYPTPLNWNATSTDVLTALQYIFHAIEAAQIPALPSDYFKEDTLLGVSGNMQWGFQINFTAYPGQNSQVQLINYTSLISYLPQHMQFDNIIVRAITGTKSNSIFIKNSVIENGDFSSFTNQCGIDNSIVRVHGGAITLPANVQIRNCDVGNNGGGIFNLSGAIFHNCNLDAVSCFQVYSGTYGLVNCFMSDQLWLGVIPGQTILMELVNSATIGVVKVDTGATLHTKGCFMLTKPQVLGTGVWENLGDVYDNRTSGIPADDQQTAIDECVPALYMDDFIGTLRPEWVARDTDGTVTVPSGTDANGVAVFTTGMVTGNTISRDFGGNCPINYAYKPEFEFRAKFDNNLGSVVEIGFCDAAGTKFIKMVWDVAQTMWHYTLSDGVTTINYSTTIYGFGGGFMHTIKFKWLANNVVAIYIDGVLDTSLTIGGTVFANIGFLQPLLSVKTTTTNQQIMTIDYFKVWQQREIVFP